MGQDLGEFLQNRDDFWLQEDKMCLALQLDSVFLSLVMYNPRIFQASVFDLWWRHMLLKSFCSHDILCFL